MRFPTKDEGGKITFLFLGVSRKAPERILGIQTALTKHFDELGVNESINIWINFICSENSISIIFGDKSVDSIKNQPGLAFLNHGKERKMFFCFLEVSICSIHKYGGMCSCPLLLAADLGGVALAAGHWGETQATPFWSSGLPMETLGPRS